MQLFVVKQENLYEVILSSGAKLPISRNSDRDFVPIKVGTQLRTPKPILITTNKKSPTKTVEDFFLVAGLGLEPRTFGL